MCEVFFVILDQAAIVCSMVIEMHHVCNQAAMRVAVVATFCMQPSSPAVSLYV